MKISAAMCNILIWTFFLACAAAEPTVEFPLIWGELMLELEQEPEPIRCQAIDVSDNGEFLWMLGDQVLANPNPRKKLADGEFEQEFELAPQIEQDGKDFSCKYIERDSQGGILSESEDKIRLKIIHEDFPAGRVKAGVYLINEPVELSVTFGIYPLPQENDIRWVVTDRDFAETTIKLGEQSGHYKSSGLVASEDKKHYYTATLTIANANMSELENKFELLVKVQDVVKRIPVSFILEQAPTEKANNRPNYPDQELSTVDPGIDEASSMSIGMIIVVAIVLIIILVCVGYCLYQKCFRSESEQKRNSSRPDYSPAATDEKNAAV